MAGEPAAMAGPAAAAGEPAGGGALSGAEKEKLREKLELLRREYSETVCRLRRARRAERARSHRRGTVAEGGRRERSPAGSRDNVSPSADNPGTSRLQTKTCSDLDAEEKTSVPCKTVPEFSGKEAGPQDSSQENLSCSSVRPAPEEKKQPQASGSLMKLRRRTKALVLEERESVCNVHLIQADETVKNPTAGTAELCSPVFRRSSLSNAEENAQRAARPALLPREGKGVTAPAAALVAVQDTPEARVPPGVPEPLLWVRGDSGHVWQPESLDAAGTAGDHEPAQPCPETSDSVLLDTSGGGGKESSGTKQTGGESVPEGEGELHPLLELLSENKVSPADGNSTTTNQSHRGNPSGTSSLNPFPTDLGNVEELSENQQLEIQSQRSQPGKATAPESALSSCTVVEGLLFPVEYYVRTTRRMSSCQRTVDLDAVILSQLGRSKKGQRSKSRQRDAHSDRPSQDRVEDGLGSEIAAFPFLGADNSWSPQNSLPASSSSSSSLGSLSQTNIAGTKRGQRRSQGKRKGGSKSSCRAPTHPGSRELRDSLSLPAPGESSSLRSNECQSEKENCEADPGKPSSEESGVSAAAAPAPGEAEGAAANPSQGGGQALGKCHQTLSGQLQNPHKDSDSLDSGNRTFASHVGGPAAQAERCQPDQRPAEHGQSQPLRGACGAEQLLAIPVPPRRSLRSSARQRASQASEDESRRGRSCPAGSEGPAVDPDTCGSLFSFRSPQWLVPRLGITEFHLPDEEFGPLKLEKLESSPANDLEVFSPRVFGDGLAAEDAHDARMNPEEKTLKHGLLSPFRNGTPKVPPVKSPASRRELSTHELLFTPAGTVSAAAPAQPKSQISSPAFPVVGATPAVLPPYSELFPTAPSAPPSQASPRPSRGASAQLVGDGEHQDSTIPLLSDSWAGSGGKEEQGTAVPLGAERGPHSQSGEAAALEEQQEQQTSCRAAPEQKKDVAEQPAPALLDGPTEESLQLVSQLKDCSSSCAVDVSTVWWDAAGGRELCVVTACESSVSLWKPLAPDRWGKAHTWQLGEVPVIQLVPLPDTYNLVCIALGELEITEIRLLLCSSEHGSFRQSLVKTGTVEAVLGLKDRRLVSSSRALQEQQVEVVWLSETGGSKDRQTLMPPEETVLAFAEVEGMRDALVGTTALNSVVVWNLRTGQLLRKMHVGYSYPASICHRAYSDSGLLFVVLSHPHAKESESCGNPAFRLVAFNPRTARSTGVMFSSLPPGHAGRYLEGDVTDAGAAAVLTSGTIAVWDLLRGRCTALLPAGPAGGWALARWAAATGCLLAGRRDGTVCLYRYRQPQPGAA